MFFTRYLGSETEPLRLFHNLIMDPEYNFHSPIKGILECRLQTINHVFKSIQSLDMSLDLLTKSFLVLLHPTGLLVSSIGGILNSVIQASKVERDPQFFTSCHRGSTSLTFFYSSYKSFRREKHFCSTASHFPFQVSISYEVFLGARKCPRPTTTRENRESVRYMLWVTSKTRSIFSPLKRFWTKERSDVETVETTSSGVQESWDEKMLGISMNRVTSPKASSLKRQVRLGEKNLGERIILHPVLSLLELEKRVPPPYLKHRQQAN